MSDISKVVYGDDVLIDLTQDTVTPNKMLAGTTAHGANGDHIEGTLVTKTFYQADDETFDEVVEEAEENDFIINEDEYSLEDADVVDNLTSTSTEDALSANQGRVLNEKNEVVSSSVNSNWQGKGYNLIPFPYYDGMSKTNNGITFTVNTDGSISISGTATANASFFIHNRPTDNFQLPIGRHKLSGIPIGFGTSLYMQINKTVGGSASTIGNAYSDGLVFDIDELSNNGITLTVVNGTTISTTIYPMIVTFHNSTYPTEYQRYGMGNVELQNTIEGVSGGDEWLSSKAYSVNNYVIYQNKLYRCKANTTAGIVPTNTTYWEQVSISSLNESLVNSSYFQKGEQFVPNRSMVFPCYVGSASSLYIEIPLPKNYRSGMTITASVNGSIVGLNAKYTFDGTETITTSQHGGDYRKLIRLGVSCSHGLTVATPAIAWINPTITFN